MADAELAGLDAHAFEQVVDQARQPQRAALQRQHQLLLLLGGIVSKPSRSSSIDASCAASGVRNSCEMFTSTESRARRTPSSSVSSRMTCTCSSSTGAALVMIVVRGAPSLRLQTLGRLRAAFDARAQDRATRFARPHDRSRHGTASARRRRSGRWPRAPARRAVAPPADSDSG